MANYKKCICCGGRVMDLLEGIACGIVVTLWLWWLALLAFFVGGD